MATCSQRRWRTIIWTAVRGVLVFVDGEVAGNECKHGSSTGCGWAPADVPCSAIGAPLAARPSCKGEKVNSIIFTGKGRRLAILFLGPHLATAATTSLFCSAASAAGTALNELQPNGIQDAGLRESRMKESTSTRTVFSWALPW